MTTSAELPPVPPPAARRGRRAIWAVAGTALALALLYRILRDVDFAEVLRHVREVRPAPLVLAVVLATLTFGLRALRWRYLLRADDGRPVPLGALWHATAIGFMANNILPFRMGEVVRAFTAARLGRVRFTTAFSSLAVERALDGLTVIALLIVGFFGAGLRPEQEIAGVRLDVMAVRAGVVCLGILGAALWVVLFPLRAERIVRAVLPFRKLADRLVNLIEAIRLGFGALRSPTRLGGAVSWSVAHWLLNAGAFYAAFFAFGIDVSFAGALLLQGLLVIGIAVPSSPGYFGVFELFVTGGLTLFGVSEAVGFAYGLTYHVTTFIPIIALGLWSLATTPISLRDATAART